MKLRSKLGLALVTAVAMLVVGSIAFAAIPDGAGEIHGCYDKQSGSLRVTDPQTNLPKSCSNKELPLDWAMRGIQGLPGPAGPQGPAGEPGADPTADAYVDRFGTDTGNAAPATGAACTLGQVLLTASGTKTAGGLPANGQLLSIAQNTALRFSSTNGNAVATITPLRSVITSPHRSF